MASYTTNLNLKKPAGSENVAIGDINNNMDIIDSAYANLGNHIIRSFTKTSVAIANGTPSSPTSITIDCSDQVPSGKAIYNAIVSVQYGNNWFVLPNFTNSAGQYLLLERVDTTSIRLKNTSTDWGTTNVAITLFIK